VGRGRVLVLDDPIEDRHREKTFKEGRKEENVTRVLPPQNLDTKAPSRSTQPARSSKGILLSPRRRTLAPFEGLIERPNDRGAEVNVAVLLARWPGPANDGKSTQFAPLRGEKEAPFVRKNGSKKGEIQFKENALIPSNFGLMTLSISTTSIDLLSASKSTSFAA